MKRLSVLMLVTACFCFIVFNVTPQTVTNLLSNPGFEGDFESRDGESPQKVAADWTPWHIPAADGSPAYAKHAPFYDEETVRIRGDEEGKSQVYFNQFATHQGGVYQQVDGLTDGASYRFSIYAWVWSSIGEDWTVSEQPGNVSVRVGIDPNGGTDGASDDIVWSTTAVFLYNAFYQYSVIADADGTTITVFVESTIGEPVANNYIYLEDAVLEVATQTVVEADASPTSETNVDLVPEDATPTQEPTAAETEAPTATETLEPTPTMTPDTQQRDPNAELEIESSETPLPSDTPVLDDPTETPLPSETPMDDDPTETPVPTATLEPTATATSAPTVTPSPSATLEPSATATVATVDPNAEEFPDTRIHVVVAGDTVSGIAFQYGSRVDAIRRANSLNAASVIVVGQRLIVPINLPEPSATPLPEGSPTLTSTPVPPSATPIPPTATITPLPTATPITYTISAGDTLVNIALRYGTTADVLATLNGIANPNQIDVGLVLLIPTAIPPSPIPAATAIPTVQPSSGVTLYTVQAGDTLDGIASAFDTTIDAIAQLNGITNPSRIFPGLVLQIPSGDSTESVSSDGQPLPTPTATLAPTPTPLPTNVPTAYTVQAGDTLFQIANLFGVSVVELAAINGIVDYNQILVGQVLTIPG